MTWHDWLDIATAVATVGAAVLAWLTIRDSRKQAAKARDNLAREWRLDFDLDVLKELADLAASANRTASVTNEITTRLGLLPRNELTNMRAVYTVHPPADAQERMAQWSAGGGNWWDGAQKDMSDEVRLLIEKRLSERAK